MSYRERPEGYRPGMRPPPPPPQYGYPPINQPFFEDTSVPQYNPQPMTADWNQQQQQQPPPYYPPQNTNNPMSFPTQLLNNPMATMAMNELADRGKELVSEKMMEKYVSISNLKYYFAVDTLYVGKKLGLIFFPFAHTDWTIKYNQDEPIAPRYDINAPDLYIPLMAFVTFILTSGYIMGTQDRFSPEQLGIQASSAMGWLILEFLIVYLSLYVLNISSFFKVCDLIAYCSYKFVCMISLLLVSVPFGSFGYFIALLYSSIALGFFLVKSLRVLILPAATTAHYSGNTRKSFYLLLTICCLQPAMMYWLSYHLLSCNVPPVLS